MALAIAHVMLALLAAPMLASLAHRTKALVAGRTGAPWLQPYRDLARLLRKGAVYSPTASWIFRASPMIGLASAVAILGVLPLAGRPAIGAFDGDFLVLAGLLALWRLAALLAALDTGSSFEGMGASREAAFSALAEPALLLALAAIGRRTGQLSLSAMFASLSAHTWSADAPALILVVAALGLVYLAESGRMPFDDPTTHLELTMIHEVMELDHSGPDLAFIGYSSMLRMWILASLIAGIAVPSAALPEIAALGASLLAMAGIAIATGLVESIMARAPLAKIPEILGSASLLSALALVLLGR